MAQPEKVTVILSNGTVSSYIPSEYEITFAKEIRKRFGAHLGKAQQVPDHGLTRETGLVDARGMAMTFRFTRNRVDRASINDLVIAYRRVHPDFVSSYDQAEDSGLSDVEILAFPPEQEEIKGLLQIRPEYNPVEELQVLTDTNHLGHGLIITRWPEDFEFSLFKQKPGGLEEINDVQKGQFVAKNKSQMKPKPLFQGRLRTGAGFEGDYVLPLLNIILDIPLGEQVVSTALADTYYSQRYGNVEEIISAGNNIDLANLLMGRPPIQRTLDYRQPPITTFTAFVDGLILATRKLL